MAIKEILKYPDPKLRTKSLDVVKIDIPAVQVSIRGLVTDLIDTMVEGKGVGISAIQIGVPLRVFVLDLKSIDGIGGYRSFINPVIKSQKDEIEYEEGCLSFPGDRLKTKRFNKLELQSYDLYGQSYRLKSEGLLSVAIQHELDHLDGILMIDRTVSTAV